MRLTLRQCLLTVAALDLAGFGLILFGRHGWAISAFALAAGILLAARVRWRALWR